VLGDDTVVTPAKPTPSITPTADEPIPALLDAARAILDTKGLAGLSLRRDAGREAQALFALCRGWVNLELASMLPFDEPADGSGLDAAVASSALPEGPGAAPQAAAARAVRGRTMPRRGA
jgi:hypothetical protein